MIAAPQGPSRPTSLHPEAQPEDTEGLPANDAVGADGDDTQTQIDMTPNTAARVADAAALASAQRKRKEVVDGAAPRVKPAKLRKQIVDSVTELVERGRGLAGRDSQSQSTVRGGGLASRKERMAQGLIKEPKYLPATTVEMRFQEIYDNPNKYFFAGMAGFNGFGKNATVNSFYAGPPGMPAQLQALFQFRVGEKGQILGAKRVPEVTVEDLDEVSADRRKRARSSVVPEVELGRDRQHSLTPGEDAGMFDFGGAADNFDDFGAGGDSTNDFSLDLGDMSPGGDFANAASAMEKTPSRLGSAQPTPSPGMLDASLQLDIENLDRANTSILAVLDDTPFRKEKGISTPAGTGRTGKNGYLSVPGTMQSGISEEQSALEESVQSASIAASRGKTGGFNRNTVIALKILEHELGPAPNTSEDADEAEDAVKTVSFQALSEKVSLASVCPASYLLADEYIARRRLGGLPRQCFSKCSFSARETTSSSSSQTRTAIYLLQAKTPCGKFVMSSTSSAWMATMPRTLSRHLDRQLRWIEVVTRMKHLRGKAKIKVRRAIVRL